MARANWPLTHPYHGLPPPFCVSVVVVVVGGTGGLSSALAAPPPETAAATTSAVTSVVAPAKKLDTILDMTNPPKEIAIDSGISPAVGAGYFEDSSPQTVKTGVSRCPPRWSTRPL